MQANSHEEQLMPGLPLIPIPRLLRSVKPLKTRKVTWSSPIILLPAFRPFYSLIILNMSQANDTNEVVLLAYTQDNQRKGTN